MGPMPGHRSGDAPSERPAPGPLGSAAPIAAASFPARSARALGAAAAAADRCELDPDISRLVRLQAGRQDALIEVLHAVQLRHGYLPKAALRQVALELQLPLSRVYGVASFYHLFQLQPPTVHRCSVCLGTACFVRGGEALLHRLSGLLGLAPDQRALNGRWGLERLSCVGACGQAPLLLIDDQVVDALPLNDPQALDQHLTQALADAERVNAERNNSEGDNADRDRAESNRASADAHPADGGLLAATPPRSSRG